MGARTRRRRSYSHWDFRGRPKVGYTTPERALAAARRLAAQHGWPQDVYQCRRCECWHHGNGRVDAAPVAGVTRVMPDGRWEDGPALV